MNASSTSAASRCVTIIPGQTFTATNTHIDYSSSDVVGPLSRLQGRLWRSPFWWLGDRVSDLRYLLWRLSR